MGPIATAYFYELIIKMTDAETDQEHIEMLIQSTSGPRQDRLHHCEKYV